MMTTVMTTMMTAMMMTTMMTTMFKIIANMCYAMADTYEPIATEDDEECHNNLECVPYLCEQDGRLRCTCMKMGSAAPSL
eukprot:11111904-Karenia_brevis.AAC.1